MLIAPCYYVHLNYKWRWLHHQQKVNNSLSNALRDVVPVMVLLEEMKKRVYLISTMQARVHCHVFKDNNAIHKYGPRTKDLNVKLHHFRDHVKRQEIIIHHLQMND